MTQTVWNVDFVPLTGNPALDRYEVVVENGDTRKECTVGWAVRPLKFHIFGLKRGTRYQINVRGCLSANFGCGPYLERPANTHR